METCFLDLFFHNNKVFLTLDQCSLTLVNFILVLENLGQRVNDSWDSYPSENPDLTIPYSVSILGHAIAGFTHFFQRSHIFFRPMRDIPTLKLNGVLLLFEGQCLPSLKSEKKFFNSTQFLCKLHTRVLPRNF